MGEEPHRKYPEQFEVEVLKASLSDAFRMTNFARHISIHFLQAREDFGGVAFGFDWIPDLLDFAVGADQKTAADNSLKQAAHEFLSTPRAVVFDHFVRWIAEQRKVELPLVTEVL
jgi:hypothetical protein